MCAFSTHYMVTADLAKTTEKRPKWTLRRPFSTACPSCIHRGSYVKMYLRQLTCSVYQTAGISCGCEIQFRIKQKAETSSLWGAEGPSALAWWRRTWRHAKHQTTSVPAIWWIHAFPWSSTTIFEDLRWISGLYRLSLVSPHPSSFTVTSDKQQEVADVGAVFLKTFPSFKQRLQQSGLKLQTAAAEDRHRPPLHLLQIFMQ